MTDLRHCTACGRPHDEYRKSKAVAVLLNLLPGPFAVLGLHRIYIGKRSGWLMIPGFYVMLLGVGLLVGEQLVVLAFLLMVAGAAATIVHIADLFRLFLGGLRPDDGWKA